MATNKSRHTRLLNRNKLIALSRIANAYNTISSEFGGEDFPVGSQKLLKRIIYDIYLGLTHKVTYMLRRSHLQKIPPRKPAMLNGVLTAKYEHNCLSRDLHLLIKPSKGEGRDPDLTIDCKLDTDEHGISRLEIICREEDHDPRIIVRSCKENEFFTMSIARDKYIETGQGIQVGTLTKNGRLKLQGKTYCFGEKNGDEPYILVFSHGKHIFFDRYLKLLFESPSRRELHRNKVNKQTRLAIAAFSCDHRSETANSYIRRVWKESPERFQVGKYIIYRGIRKIDFEGLDSVQFSRYTRDWKKLCKFYPPAEYNGLLTMVWNGNSVLFRDHEGNTIHGIDMVTPGIITGVIPELKRAEWTYVKTHTSPNNSYVQVNGVKYFFRLDDIRKHGSPNARRAFVVDSDLNFRLLIDSLQEFEITPFRSAIPRKI